jgi:hypothetical protein
MAPKVPKVSHNTASAVYMCEEREGEREREIEKERDR